MSIQKDSTEMSSDKYVYGMDWGNEEVSIGSLNNYRQYQYDLIGEFIGTEVLEVGSGASRSFTKLIVNNVSGLERLLSIEPSETLFQRFELNNSYRFPDCVEFQNIDLFDLDPQDTGLFDTVIFVHVLEHIEKDRAALDHASQFLKKGGLVLIEVPALPVLYSVHDEMLGHFRRYNKSMLRAAVDQDRYTIKKLWYNDIVGVLGSLYYFKFKKVRLKSDTGVDVVKKRGKLYDQYMIPFQKRVERHVRMPFGLSLCAVLERK